MILQQNRPLLRRAELLAPHDVFAAFHQGIEERGKAVVFQHFEAVEVVLHVVVGVDNDTALVPFAGRTHCPAAVVGFVGGDEVVQRGEGAVARCAEFGVGVPGIVEDLEFEADGGTFLHVFRRDGHRLAGLVFVGVLQQFADEVFHPGISAFGKVEIEH